MINDVYNEDDMKDMQVPSIMDINDATLEDGVLTLYCTVQYDDESTEECTFVIKGFTGESGTYELVPEDDTVMDVADGDINVDVEATNESIKFTGISYDIDVKGKKYNAEGLTESFLISATNK